MTTKDTAPGGVARSAAKEVPPLLGERSNNAGGRQVVNRLARHLGAELRPAAVLGHEDGDIDDALRHAQDWGHALPDRVHQATTSLPMGREAPSVSR